MSAPEHRLLRLRVNVVAYRSRSSCGGRGHSGRSTAYDFLSLPVIHPDASDSPDCFTSVALSGVSVPDAAPPLSLNMWPPSN